MNIGKMNRWLAVVVFCMLNASLTLIAAVRSGDKLAVVGKLESAVAYGPPNFGENPDTDKKEAYVALVLLSPIDVSDTDGTVSANIKRAQIIVPNEEHEALAHKLKQLVGSAVEIVGQVFPATTGHHHEPIVIVMKSVKKVNPKGP